MKKQGLFIKVMVASKGHLNFLELSYMAVLDYNNCHICKVWLDQIAAKAMHSYEGQLDL